MVTSYLVACYDCYENSKIELVYHIKKFDFFVHTQDLFSLYNTFDIISIYKNLIQERDTDIYYASCGFGYLTVLKSLISLGINTGLNVKIYSDKDKSDYNHIDYLFNKSHISPWLDTIQFHRNNFENEKDYGVPKERIIDTYRIVK